MKRIVALIIIVIYFVISIFVMQNNSRYARSVFKIGIEEKEQIDSLIIKIKDLEEINDSLINIIKNDTNNRDIPQE